MASEVQLMLNHAREFTNHELLTLRVWFDVDAAGNDELAERVLDKGLMLEHFTSLLPNDPALRTPDMIVEQQTLAFEFQRVLDEATKFLVDRAQRFGKRQPIA